MPILQIRYTTEESGHAIKEEIEWVSPTGWTIDRSIESFKLRHPRTSITGYSEQTAGNVEDPA